MQDVPDRRSVALQEAQKTYAMQYAMTVALREDLPVLKTDVEDDILRIAERYDSFLRNGETGLTEKAKTTETETPGIFERRVEN